MRPLALIAAGAAGVAVLLLALALYRSPVMGLVLGPALFCG